MNINIIIYVIATALLCGCTGKSMSASDTDATDTIGSGAPDVTEQDSPNVVPDTVPAPSGYDSAPAPDSVYSVAYLVHDNALIVGKWHGYGSVHNRLGMIDLKGKEILPGQYKWLFPARGNEDVIEAEDVHGVTHFFDHRGKELTPSRKNMKYAGENYYTYSQKGSSHNVLLDAGGNKILALSDGSDIKFVSNGRVIFTGPKGDKYGIATLEGQILVKPQYHDILPYGDDLAGVVDTDLKIGFVDKNGKMVIKPKYYVYEEMYCGEGHPDNVFSEGLCHVFDSKSGSAGYIDKKGRVVIPFRYHWPEAYKNGLAKVEIYSTNEPETAYIDKRGKGVSADSKAAKRYAKENAKRYSHKLIEYKKLWHVVDQDGRVVMRDVAYQPLNYLLPG